MHVLMKRTYSFELETTTFAQQWLSLLKKLDDHCTAVGQEGVGPMRRGITAEKLGSCLAYVGYMYKQTFCPTHTTPYAASRMQTEVVLA